MSQSSLSLRASSFYFLRHGQTQCNSLRVFQQVDEPLNAIGLEQAGQAALVLADEKFTRVVCSDLVRTLQTAQAVCLLHGLEPQTSAALRERHFGDLIGTSSADIDWAETPPGGESLTDFVARSIQGLTAALNTHDATLIVAHGGTLHVLMAALQIVCDAQVFANATPLKFEKHATGWHVCSLQRLKPGTSETLGSSTASPLNLE